MDIQSLTALSDADILTQAKRLADNERQATAALIAHLAEIDTRRLYLGEGCSSLFTYCVRVLHLSEPAAYNRIQAARTAQRFPAVLLNLEQGTLHLAAVRLLAPLLTADNHRKVLAAAAHKSKREVEELVARLCPQPDAPDQVRKLPGGKPAPARGLFEQMASPGEPEAVPPPPVRGTGGTAHAAEPARAVVVPLAPERYKVQFTAGAATREKLRRAQELLRHRVPDGDVAQVIDLALDLLVRDLARQKFASMQRPQRGACETPGTRPESPVTPARSQPASRYIPAAVRRAVWERDQGCCAFVSPGGERCTEKGGLEFDHIRPHADGGGAAVENVRLLCRQHNRHEAQQFFGLWRADPMQHPAGCH